MLEGESRKVLYVPSKFWYAKDKYERGHARCLEHERSSLLKVRHVRITYFLYFTLGRMLFCIPHGLSDCKCWGGCRRSKTFIHAVVDLGLQNIVDNSMLNFKEKLTPEGIYLSVHLFV